jgi:NADPH:quinone reductase-like Zn-dependent oxidoreductase
MRALVYHGPGNKSWDEVPDPTIQQDTDAIVQVDAVTICGTDLHILKGDVPAVTDGRILGHEAVGTVVEVGSGVKNVRDRRSRTRFLHHRMRPLPLLPPGQLRAVPGRRWLDPGAPH